MPISAADRSRTFLPVCASVLVGRLDSIASSRREAFVLLKHPFGRRIFGPGSQGHRLALALQRRIVFAPEGVDLGEQSHVLVIGRRTVFFGLPGATKGEVQITMMRRSVLVVADDACREDEERVRILSLWTREKTVGDLFGLLGIFESK